MFTNLDAKGITQGVTAVCPTLDSSPSRTQQNSASHITTPSYTSAFSIVSCQKAMKCESKSPLVMDSESDTPPYSGENSSGKIRRAVEQWKYILKEGPSGIQYECSECQCTYKHKKSLNKHWKDKHPHLLNSTSLQTSTSQNNNPLSRSKSLMCPSSTPRRGRTSFKRLRDPTSELDESPSIQIVTKRAHINQSASKFQQNSKYFHCTPRSSLPPMSLYETTIDSENVNLNHPFENSSNNNALDLSIASTKETPLDLTCKKISSSSNTSLPLRLPLQNHNHRVNQDNFDVSPGLLRPRAMKPKTPMNSNQIFPKGYSPNIAGLSVIQQPSISECSLSHNQLITENISNNMKPPENFAQHQQHSSTVSNLQLSNHIIHGPLMSLPQPFMTQIPHIPVYKTTNPDFQTVLLESQQGPSDSAQVSTLSESTNCELSVETDQVTKCSQCLKVFNSWDSLNSHFLDYHYNLVISSVLKKVEVWKSNIQLSNKELEDYLVRNSDGSQKYGCKSCEYSTAFGTEFQRHYQQKHKRDRCYSCCVCDKNYKWRWDLARHFHKCHASLPSNPYEKYLQPERNSCRRNSSPILQPASHDSSSESDPTLVPIIPAPTESQLPCPRCQYKARWPSELRSHMVNHSGHRAFGCQFCGYRAKWKWDVAKHLKRCREAAKQINLPATNDYLVQYVTYSTPPPDDILHEFRDDGAETVKKSVNPTSTHISTSCKKEKEEMNHNNTPPVLRKEVYEDEDEKVDKEYLMNEMSSEYGDRKYYISVDANSRSEKLSTPHSPVVDLPTNKNKSSLPSFESLVKKEFNTKVIVSDIESKHNMQLMESYCNSDLKKSTINQIKIKLKRCPFCDYMSGNARELQEHVQNHNFDNE